MFILFPFAGGKMEHISSLATKKVGNFKGGRDCLNHLILQIKQREVNATQPDNDRAAAKVRVSQVPFKITHRDTFDLP